MICVLIYKNNERRTKKLLHSGDKASTKIKARNYVIGMPLDSEKKLFPRTTDFAYYNHSYQPQSKWIQCYPKTVPI